MRRWTLKMVLSAPGEPDRTATIPIGGGPATLAHRQSYAAVEDAMIRLLRLGLKFSSDFAIHTTVTADPSPKGVDNV